MALSDNEIYLINAIRERNAEKVKSILEISNKNKKILNLNEKNKSGNYSLIKAIV